MWSSNMRISKEYFNQLNPSYQKVIADLEEEICKRGGCFVAAENKILEFSVNYLLPKKYWRKIMKLCTSHTAAWRAYYQFYWDVNTHDLIKNEDDNNIFFKAHKFIYERSLDGKEPHGDFYDPDKTHLSFPHSHLIQSFNLLESETNQPLSKEFVEKYEANKSYSEKMKAAEKDFGKWFKVLCEAAEFNKDQEIVKHNMEYRLGTNLLDTKLWKFYIEYLRERDPKEMLQVYSKYCRFFLDDFEMKERYKQEVEKYGPVCVKWKNLFDFEEGGFDGFTSDEESENSDVNESSENDDEKSIDKTEELEFDNSNAPVTSDKETKNESESKASNSYGPTSPKRMRLTSDKDKSDEEVEEKSHKEEYIESSDSDTETDNSYFNRSDDDESDDGESDEESEEEEAENKSSAMEPDNEKFSHYYMFSSNIIKHSKKFKNTCQGQHFPFKSPIMSHILENANSNVLRKLHATCKYFYTRKQSPVIHRLTFSESETSFEKESLYFDNHDEYLSLFKNGCISTTFDARDMFARIISKIITKLYRCDAKYIFVQCKLSFNERKFLIESGNVVIFEWTRDMNYYKPENDVRNCALEDIVQYMPRVEKLLISPIRITSTTFTTLLNLKFVSKIYDLKLKKIEGEPFDVNTFLEFCNKNRARRFVMKMKFDSKFFNPAFVNDFKEKIESYQKSTKETVI